MLDHHQKNIATFIHLSTFSRFIIPFGNFIGPLILWLSNKEKSEFIDSHGKQIINFQISLLLYTIIITCISIPFFLFQVLNGIDFYNLNDFHFSINQPLSLIITALVFAFFMVIAFILELILIIIASIKAKNGEIYHYPLTIQFIK